MPEADFAERQAAVDQKAAGALQAYPGAWQEVTRSWLQSSGDEAWLTYSANYLLHTGGVHWALDPFSLYTRLGQCHPSDLAADLAPLEFIVLSHAHADHLDLALLSAVKDLPVTWVIPGFMLEKVARPLLLPSSRLVVPEPDVPIIFGGLALTPFEARHFHTGGGVPEMGYLAEFSGKRWLFPGDTRNYTIGGFPAFEDLDGAFAHLWLGKRRALDAHPPELDAFCRFFSGMQARRLVVTHLYEFGRDARDLWDEHHYEMVRERLGETAPETRVDCSRMADRVEL